MAAAAPLAGGALLDARITAIDAAVARLAAAVVPIPAMQAQLAQLAAGQLQLQAQLDAMQQQQQQQQQVQLAAMQLQLNGISAALGLAGAGAAALDQARAAARRANAVASDAPLILVPTAGGGAPAAWPAGFDLAALWALPSAASNALLADYALPAGGSINVRRQRLAHHIGVLSPA